MNNKQVFSLGLALFAIFFGAGNVVFPLALGRTMGDQVWPAIIGIFISAVIMPLTGLLAGALFLGDYRAFFNRIGSVPGELFAFLCMIFIGPFGAIPRIITLSHSAFAWYFPSFKLWLFSILSGIFVWLLTIRKNEIIGIIGKYLGPIKVTLLITVIMSAFFIPASTQHTDFSSLASFKGGFLEGFLTMDLLVAIFFAKLVVDGLDKALLKQPKRLLNLLCKAGAIGSLLLGGIYVGFMLAGSLHGSQVPCATTDQLIFALSDYLLGRLGVISSFTVAAACLTTAIALTSLFSDYLSREVFKRRISYRASITFTVFVMTAFANLGFDGIMKMIVPVVTLCSPALIVLAIFNVLHKTHHVNVVKVPVYLTLMASFAMKYGGLVLSYIRN